MDRDRVSSDLISGQARAADRNPCHYLCSGSEVGSIKEQHLHDREDLCPSLQPFVRVVCSKMCNLGSVAGPTATSRPVCAGFGEVSQPGGVGKDWTAHIVRGPTPVVTYTQDLYSNEWENGNFCFLPNTDGLKLENQSAKKQQSEKCRIKIPEAASWAV